MTEHPTPDNAEESAPVYNADIPHATPERPLSEVARRALLEAAERRAAEAEAEALAEAQAVEHGGRKVGLEPTRYGDWEKKGLAIDF